MLNGPLVGKSVDRSTRVSRTMVMICPAVAPAESSTLVPVIT